MARAQVENPVGQLVADDLEFLVNGAVGGVDPQPVGFPDHVVVPGLRLEPVGVELLIEDADGPGPVGRHLERGLDGGGPVGVDVDGKAIEGVRLQDCLFTGRPQVVEGDAGGGMGVVQAVLTEHGLHRLARGGPDQAWS